MNELDDYIDLHLTQRGFDLITSDRTYVNLQTEVAGDLSTHRGRNNLAQAIVNRLLTRRGELEELGHPEYGSRLHELIGELNNLRLRVLTELYIRDCLAQETRIEAIKYIEFLPPERGINRNVLTVTIGILPMGEQQPFGIVLPLNI